MSLRRLIQASARSRYLLIFLIIPIATLTYGYATNQPSSPSTESLPRWDPNLGFIISDERSLYGQVAVTNQSYLSDRTFGNPLITLYIDGYVQCSTHKQDTATTTLLALIPISAHTNPKTALNIGDGCGTTTEILASNVDSVDALEINQKVREARERYFYPKGDNVDLIMTDARYFFASDNVKYDIIVSEPNHPWVPYSSHLYTLEFFQEMREHLNDGGIVSQWVPSFAFTEEAFKIFYATFDSVFPYNYGFMMEMTVLDLPIHFRDGDRLRVIQNTHMILIGSLQPLSFIYDDRVRDDLRKIGLEDVGSIQIFDHYEMEGFSDGARLNTDDSPILEFMTKRYNPEDRIKNELGIIDAIRKQKGRL